MNNKSYIRFRFKILYNFQRENQAERSALYDIRHLSCFSNTRKYTAVLPQQQE